MNEAQLQEIILKTITELVGKEGKESPSPAPGPKVDPGEVPDLSTVDYRKIVDVPNPANEEEYRLLRAQTVARLGVWRAGPRYRTNTFLRFRADHAVAMDAVTEALGAKVTVILLGERPGLATGESMSAYMTYGGYVGIPEANRTVVSNIHRGGTTPTEAGAFIAELCLRMLREKASGLDLKV